MLKQPTMSTTQAAPQSIVFSVIYLNQSDSAIYTLNLYNTLPEAYEEFNKFTSTDKAILKIDLDTATRTVIQVIQTDACRLENKLRLPFSAYHRPSSKFDTFKVALHNSSGLTTQNSFKDWTSAWIDYSLISADFAKCIVAHTNDGHVVPVAYYGGAENIYKANILNLPYGA